MADLRIGFPNLSAAYSDPITNRISETLQRSATNASQQSEGSRVQLSSFAQLKSAVSGVGEAAKGLRDENKLVKAEDARQSAQNLVDAFNNVNSLSSRINTASGSTSANGQTKGAQAVGGVSNSDQIRIQSSVRDLRQAFVQGTDSGLNNDLKRIGISFDRSGNAQLDAKTFNQAFLQDSSTVKRILGDVGQRVETAANQQVGDSGTIGALQKKAESQLQASENRANALTQVTSANVQNGQNNQSGNGFLAELNSQQQRSAQGPSPFAFTGATAYRQLFSL